MQIRGKILSISGDVAEICIIRENTACGSCSDCSKKMGVGDIMKVAVINGIQIGQVVVLRRNINWFFKNRIMLVLIAFVLGIIVTETAAAIISFDTYRGGIGMIVGGIFTLIVIVVLLVKKPKYLFRIAQTEMGGDIA